MKLTLRLLGPHEVPWEELDCQWDRTVFQTRAWLQYLAETRAMTPVVAEVRECTSRVGYFTGMILKRFGVRLLGSPLPGWTTPFMGFNLPPAFPRHEALGALRDFAFEELGCLHLEVCDRYLEPLDRDALAFQLESYGTYYSDLTQSEEEILAGMKSACRRNLRKAARSGLQIEQASDIAFADEYYRQLEEVFSKRRQAPTYRLESVRALIRNLLPTGRLLLVRARDRQGRCIATGIFPAMNQISEFWGNASTKCGLLLRPNELIHWYAMRYWKARGIQWHDWGGGGSYKEKYGGRWMTVPRLICSRWSFLPALRRRARDLYRLKSQLSFRMGAIRGLSSSNELASSGPLE